MLRVKDLFENVGLAYNGPIAWETAISERGPGVYVVSLRDRSPPSLDCLNDIDLAQWIDDEEILYIGRSKHLQRRLREFYRHKYGDRRPHRGGQALLQLICPKLVTWAAVDDYAGAEHRLIDAFTRVVGKKPFANRMRAARMRA